MTDTLPIAEMLAAELHRHAMVRPAGEPTTWCVCLCWSTGRYDLQTDELAYEEHVATRLAATVANWDADHDMKVMRTAFRNAAILPRWARDEHRHVREWLLDMASGEPASAQQYSECPSECGCPVGCERGIRS